MILETAIALVAIFAGLVMFHELGHFITARLVGIRVEECAFGFGPKLVRLFKRGDTEYTIHPVPLGGFVKLAGMEPGEEDVADGFQAQPTWKRALVIFSGPLASFVLAVVAFLLLGTIWGFQSETKTLNRVLMVNPQTVAADTGLRAGDEIVKIDGKRITTGNEMVELIHAKPGEQITLVVKRDGNTLHKTATPSYSITYLGANWSFMKSQRATVENVITDSAAAKAGIKAKDKLISIDGQEINSGPEMVQAIEENRGRVGLELRRNGEIIRVQAQPTIQWVRVRGVKWSFPLGLAEPAGTMPALPAGFEPYDRIVSIDGRKIKTGSDMAEAVHGHANGSLDFVVERGSKEKTVQVKLKDSARAHVETGTYSVTGLLGFLPEFAFEKTGFVDSITRGLEITWLRVRLVIDALTPSRISESVGGPLMIAKQTSTMVALGPYYVMLMAGMLSLSLALLNLLPIPVLDGGHLAIIAVESVRRRRLTPQQMAAAQMVGLALIVLLAAVVFWNDLWKLSHGMVPQ